MATTITPKQREDFLAALAEGDTLEAAARKAGGPSRRTWLRLREADPEFDGEVLAAQDAGKQMLEQRFVDIGLGRVEVKGNSAVTATLLVLKKRDPEWREAAKLNPVPRLVHERKRDFSRLSDDELRRLERLLERLEREPAET